LYIVHRRYWSSEKPLGNSRDFLLCHVMLPFNNCPSARCATAANSVCSDSVFFTRQIIAVSLIDFIITVLLCKYLLFVLCLFHTRPVYFPLLFLFVCSAVPVIGILAVDSSHY
jgi:hypothetical protein